MWTGKQFKRISLEEIVPNPNQPRKIFDMSALNDLADSIAQYGVITPLTVRRGATGYELIAGERRLRASKMAGLDNVPCYILEVDEEESSLMALVENLQRRDLDFFEEAQGLIRLTEIYGMTQQQAATKIGKTQSAVANKMRLLKLCPDTIDVVRKFNLTERHARALLQIEDWKLQTRSAYHIVKLGFNVEKSERYIEQVLNGDKKSAQRTQRIIKDVRLFINTINRAVSVMQGAGVGAQIERVNDGTGVVLTIRIPNATA